MAFSWGAAAGGASDALEKILAERRATALMAQNEADKQAQREFQDRQLAQQLKIAEMVNARQIAQANATSAAKALASIGTRYKDLGKAVVEGTLVGQQVPQEEQTQFLGAQTALELGGQLPVLPAGLSVAPTLPYQRIMPGLTAEMPTATPTPLTSPESVATLPEAPMERVRPIAGLQRIEGPVGQQILRVPTAKEAALMQFNQDVAKINTNAAPEQVLTDVSRLQSTISKYPEPVQPEIRAALAALFQSARDRRDAARQQKTDEELSGVRRITSALAEAHLDKAQRENKQLEALKSLTPEQQDVTDAIISSIPENRIGSVSASLTRAATRGPEAFTDESRRQVLNTLPVEDRRQAIARLGAIDAITKLQSVFAGLPTGVVSGNVQAFINQRLGRGADPKLVKAQAQAQIFLQNYRRAMTGVAWSKGEASEYARFVPDITNAEDLNVAQLNGFASSLIDNNNAFWNIALGEPRSRTIGVWKKSGVVSNDPNWGAR